MAKSESSLRWGLLCDGLTFPAWQARCLRELLAQASAAPALVILEAPRGPRAHDRSSLWEIYESSVAASLSSERLEGLHGAFVQTPVLLRQSREAFFQGEELAEIREHALDFILCLSRDVLHGEILSTPRHGVWSFRFGRADGYRDAPGIAEMDRRDAVIAASLVRWTQASGGVVLDSGFFPIRYGSYRETLDGVRFGSASFPARIVRRILASGPAALSGPLAAPVSPEAPRAPDNLRMGAHLARRARDTLVGYYDWLFRVEQWNIGVVDTPVEAFLQPEFRPEIRWAPTQGRRRYLADPFGLPQGDSLAVFAEDYDHESEHGHIAVLRSGTNGRFGDPEPVIELPQHLSYPYLFQHGGEVYCIPEAFQTREVRLFRARQFPRDWEMAAVLIEDFAAVDPTLFQHEGRFWLLCTDQDSGSGTKLHAFHAPDLLGPWTPHAANPVKTDVRSSRPAGRPFVVGGRLYRPAQDCSRTYGGAVAINRILTLTPTEFAEEVVRVVEPDPRGQFPDGFHTLSSVGDVTLIDGKRMIFGPFALRRALEGKLRAAASRWRRAAPAPAPDDR